MEILGRHPKGNQLMQLMIDYFDDDDVGGD